MTGRRWVYGPRSINTATKGEDGIWHWAEAALTENFAANPCNADVLALPDGTLLFSYIKEEKKRAGLTLAASRDNGRTWTDILTVQPGPAAYSTMVLLKNGDVGILYEDGSRSADNGYDIVFTRIPRRLIRRALPSC